MTSRPSVILIVADGARPDVLRDAIDAGHLPALARVRDEGTMQTLTSVFPSVTGPAYAPFLLGMHPGTLGLPGLRWYDRSRRVTRWPGYSRSYVGAEYRFIDTDLSNKHLTIFELIARARRELRASRDAASIYTPPLNAPLGSLAVIRRGLPRSQWIEGGLKTLARAARIHFRGDVRGWLAFDRDMGDRLVDRIARDHPPLTFAAFTGIDKTSHAYGADSADALHAMKIVDDVVARIRVNAEHAGRWATTHLWIVSDHGHAPVHHHDDVADAVREMGVRVRAHPKLFTRSPGAAVMVSGNAMAHIYLDLASRTRAFWNALQDRWERILHGLLHRDSVDLALVPTSFHSCDIHSRNGVASLSWDDCTYRYTPTSGDPLQLGETMEMSDEIAYHVTRDTDYPDSVVQIAKLAASSRSGDIILSAAPGYDFRARYEPIPHVSSHGSLRSDHMLVPFLTNQPMPSQALRTVDIMPSAAALLGIDVPDVDGRNFVSPYQLNQSRTPLASAPQ